MSQTSDKSEMLGTTRWGSIFDVDEIDTIAEYMEARTFIDGQSIFEQGDTDPYLAFIIAGQVDIAKEVSEFLEKIVVTLRTKAHFGEMAFIDGKPRSASAIANGEVTLLVLTRDKHEELIRTHPELGLKIQQNLLLVITSRLRMTTRELIYRT